MAHSPTHSFSFLGLPFGRNSRVLINPIKNRFMPNQAIFRLQNPVALVMISKVQTEG
jgi:hypothetical protein